MRRDSIGFFWEDKPVVKVKKAPAPKRTPPDRTWETGRFLPNLEAARNMRYDLASQTDLLNWSSAKALGRKREVFVFDIESYPNYALIAFRHVGTGKLVIMEAREDDPSYGWNMKQLEWMLNNYRIVGYNSTEFDCGILSVALDGHYAKKIYEYTDRNIVQGERAYRILRSFKVKPIYKTTALDHVDLMEVAPGVRISLKVYGARLGTKYMQDLPFRPGTWLDDDQITITRWYCANDLEHTELTYKALDLELTLREDLSREHGIDMMSKSDAQIAEAIISKDVGRINGVRPQVPTIVPGTVYKFRQPPGMAFTTPAMQWVLQRVLDTDFVVGLDGKIQKPETLKNLVVPIGHTQYTMGIGGLHSKEEQRSLVTKGTQYRCFDIDAESFYPNLILTQELYPLHLGPAFLHVFGQIVRARLDAKHRGDKRKSDSLKITINGTYGKLGSEYSILYSPDLLIQTTLSGQLFLLMMVERLELAGIHVVSGNTDGIMVMCHEDKLDTMRAVVKQWERDVQFKTEEVEYESVHSANINNYIAFTKSGKTKTKGWFAEQGIKKSPATQVCVDAVVAFLRDGTPFEQTVKACTDLTKFLRVQQVNGGGAVQLGTASDGGNVLLGKVARWYYTAEETPEIVIAKNGNLVPRTERGKPLMTLPDTFPEDLDHTWYVDNSRKLLETITGI